MSYVYNFYKEKQLTSRERNSVKVYISCDLEGITGVVKENQLSSKGENYDRARKIMTREINAAAEGAFEAGASVVVINDAHGEMDNILIEVLGPRIELISGNPKEFSMMEGIWAGFDLGVFLGYHAMKSKKGVIAHTYSSSVIWEVRINHIVVGETGINAMVAGHYDVPIGLVSGDDVVVKEAKDILGENIEFVETKKSLSKYSAWNRPLEESCNELKYKLKETVKHIDKLRPLKTNQPVRLEVTFTDVGYLEQALLLPGLKELEQSNFLPMAAYEADDILEAYKALRTILVLTNSVS